MHEMRAGNIRKVSGPAVTGYSRETQDAVPAELEHGSFAYNDSTNDGECNEISAEAPVRLIEVALLVLIK